jgi:flagellar biosynthesis component FlhA
MPMWMWIVIGLGSFLGLSLLVGFALARVLGTIGVQLSEMHEREDWTNLPPARASKDVEEQQPDEVEEQQPDEVEAKASRVVRLR